MLQAKWRIAQIKIIFQPASCLEKLLVRLLGSSEGDLGGSFQEGGLDFLEVALVWKFPYGILWKQVNF